MQNYGDFEVVRKLAEENETTIYAARKCSSSGPETHTLKVFAPHPTTSDPDSVQPDVDSALMDAAQAAIEVQARAAADSPFIAPIVAHGRNQGSVWSVTLLCPQSLERILRQRTRLSNAQTVHLLVSAAKGALGLKRAGGRSHGNLKPKNLLVTMAGSLQSAKIVLTDPLPGGAELAEAYELADLNSIGQILYGIVRRKEMLAQDWRDLFLPLELSSDWNVVFGKDAPSWLALCNRLLDHQLTLSVLNLEKLVAELEQFGPKPLPSRRVLATAALGVVGLVGAVLWWMTRPPSRVPTGQDQTVVVAPPSSNRTTIDSSSPTQKVVVVEKALVVTNTVAVAPTRPTNRVTGPGPIVRQSNDPGLNVTVTIEPSSLRSLVGISNVSTRQFRLGAPGSFALKPGPSQFELLLPHPWPRKLFNLEITNGPQKFLERIPAGSFNLESIPSGAQVFAGTNYLGVTPINDLDWPPGSYVLEWRLPNYETNRLNIDLRDRSEVRHREKLRELSSPVRLMANLEGALVSLKGTSQNWRVGPGGTYVGLFGTNTLIAEFKDPERGNLAPITITNVVARREVTNEYRFEFAYGTVKLQPPPGATLIVDGHELLNRPILRYQPATERVTYQITAPHFNPTNLTLSVGANGTISNTVELIPKLYSVYLEVDPPGAQLTLRPSGQTVKKGVNQLAWGDGRYEVAGAYPGLSPATAQFAMNELGVTQALTLPYARVSFTNEQSGLPVFEGASLLGRTPIDVYLAPGPHTFTFDTGAGPTNWNEVLIDRAYKIIPLPYRPRPALLINSIGVRLVYIKAIDLYVGQFELSRSQYATQSKEPITTGCNSPECPIAFISWANAVDFCAKLSANLKEKDSLRTQGLSDWNYSLPNESEWAVFAPLADLQNEPGALLGLDNADPQPLSPNRRSTNSFNLYDLHGNVAEFCLGKDGTKLAMGGSVSTKALQAGGRREASKNEVARGRDEVGFRVVLRRGPP